MCYNTTSTKKEEIKMQQIDIDLETFLSYIRLLNRESSI